MTANYGMISGWNKIKRMSFYKNRDDYHIEIAGSSKSVYKFHQKILSMMSKSRTIKDEDSWYDDEIVFPHKYKKAMSLHLSQDDSKPFDYLSIIDWIINPSFR
jgi:uncharacterized coiled-coil DUF342 family protein